jgi:cytochrome P450
VRTLPGPRALPVIGNLHQIEVSRLHLVLEGWARTYGPAYRVALGRRPAVVLSDPALIGGVLRDRPSDFRRVRTLAPILTELGMLGVFGAEGEAWRPQRRLATAALSRSHLQGFFPILRLVGRRLVQRWERAADRGDIIDILDDFQRFAVDVMTSLAFGRDVNTVEGMGGGIQECLQRVFPMLARRLNARLPTWRWYKSRADREVDTALARLRGWLAEVVEEARGRLAATPEAVAGNFLEAMLLARDESGAPFSDETIFGNAMTMLLAGEDTTASTLAWAVHELCGDAAAVARLRAEAQQCFPDVVPDTLAHVSSLAYAQAVANETMRLRPVAPVMMQESTRDVVLDQRIAVPAGTRLMLLSRFAATSSEHVEQPWRFRPERWLDPERAAELQRKAVLIPFGSGPRLCPGRNLALIEMQMMLAVLYRSFDVEPVGPRSSVAEHYGFTMTPRGLRVRLRRRPDAAAHAATAAAAAAATTSGRVDPTMEQQ